MRKILAFTAVLLFSGMLLFSEGVQEQQSDETLVKVTAVSVDEQGNYKIDTLREDGSRVIYIASPETTESEIAFSDIADGDYLLVKDSGIMTMSLPPQMPLTALRDVTEAVNAGLISFDESAQENLPAVEIAIGNVTRDDLDAAFSYSYGYLSMEGLMTQNMYPRGGYFARGVLDASEIGSTEPLLTPEEMSSSR